MESIGIVRGTHGLVKVAKTSHFFGVFCSTLRLEAEVCFVFLGGTFHVHGSHQWPMSLQFWGDIIPVKPIYFRPYKWKDNGAPFSRFLRGLTLWWSWCFLLFGVWNWSHFCQRYPTAKALEALGLVQISFIWGPKHLRNRQFFQMSISAEPQRAPHRRASSSCGILQYFHALDGTFGVQQHGVRGFFREDRING